jgi:hypothetical protein
MIVSGGLLYTAQDGFVFTVTPLGTVSQLTGTLTGLQPVTWAQNTKTPIPDLVVVSENGAFLASPAGIVSYPSVNLPVPNSVAQLDGFFLFTIGDGRIFASDLRSTSVSALSFVSTQANPDGLLRGTVHGPQYFAWGQASCEVYQNAGLSPFPLSRVHVIEVGLIAPQAIAGFGTGWDGPQIFVAMDGTVRRVDGYNTPTISTKDVERSIKSVVDKNTLRASVYVDAGHRIWSLSCALFTWEYNVSTGYWHERQSNIQPSTVLARWRGEQTALFNGSWVVGDVASGKLMRVTESAFTEDGSPVSMLIESGPVKEFPEAIYIASVFADWTTGTAPLVGSVDATDPRVAISWSLDGGASWSTPVLENSLGREGEFSNRIRVNRIGISSQHGARFRLLTSSPVYRTLRSMTCVAAGRGAS